MPIGGQRHEIPRLQMLFDRCIQARSRTKVWISPGTAIAPDTYLAHAALKLTSHIVEKTDDPVVREVLKDGFDECQNVVLSFTS